MRYPRLENSLKNVPRTRLILFACAVFVLSGVYAAYAIMPCPVVADTTFPQMAQQWVSGMTNPFTKYMEEKYALLLKQKTAAGIWGQGQQIYGLYTKADNLGRLLESTVTGIGDSKLDWIKRTAGISTYTGARNKMGNLQTQATVNIFSGGKNALKLAEETEALLQQFSPLQFDYASKSQVQKDMAKMARVQARTQAEILWLVSSMKMQEELLK